MKKSSILILVLLFVIVALLYDRCTTTFQPSSIIPSVEVSPIPKEDGKSKMERIIKYQDMFELSTDFVRADYLELKNCIEKLKSSNGDFDDDDGLYGFKLYVYKMNYKEGEELFNMMKSDRVHRNNDEVYKLTYDELLEKYRNSEDRIIKKYYEGRASIMAHLTYKGQSVKTDHYTDNAGEKILTQFNVGRLCPPKCPPAALY